MKTIFPKADETLLLDVLANADENVQKASEQLISLGYEKKDYAPKKPPRSTEISKLAAEDESKTVKIIPLKPKEYTPEEKEESKSL